MRRLGLARAVKQILVRRTPPNPLFDAVLLVSLTLLDTALEHTDDAPVNSSAVHRKPVYAVHTVVDQAVSAVDSQKKMRRSEEHTSELQSLMRTPYAVFCLKKKKKT